MARVRSPNYPSIPLKDALDLVEKIRLKESRNFTTREVISKLIGYSGLNGAALQKIGAMTAFGLLERGKNSDLRVSELFMSIMYSRDDAEKSKAINASAYKPTIFKELHENWPDRPVSTESLQAYLIRNGFNTNSVDSVITCYRQTIEFAEQHSEALDIHPDNLENAPDQPSSDILTRDQGVNRLATPVNTHISGARNESVGVPMYSGTSLPAQKPILFDMDTVSGTYSFDNSEELQAFIDKLLKIKDLLPRKS